MIDLSAFKNAVDRLGEALADREKLPEITTLRDGTIQRFEFTYDLGVKTLRRFLHDVHAVESDLANTSFRQTIRLGSDYGLTLNGLDRWAKYREARNITSHTYDKEKADEVLEIIPSFYEEAQFLLAQMIEGLNA